MMGTEHYDPRFDCQCCKGSGIMDATNETILPCARCDGTGQAQPHAVEHMDNIARNGNDGLHYDLDGVPAGATHYDPEAKQYLNQQGYYSWFGRGHWVPHTEGFDFELIRPRLVPVKPAAPEWGGQGLPPVGTIVEYASSDELGDAGAERWKEGDEIEILAHKTCGAEKIAVVWNITVQEASQRLAEWKGKAIFRPLRTKEQRDRDEIIDAAVRLERSWMDARQFATKLYEAGMLTHPKP